MVKTIQKTNRREVKNHNKRLETDLGTRASPTKPLSLNVILMKMILENNSLKLTILKNGEGQLESKFGILRTKGSKIYLDKKEIFSFNISLEFTAFVKLLFKKKARMGKYIFEGQEKLIFVKGTKSQTVIVEDSIVLEGTEYLEPLNLNLENLCLSLMLNVEKYYND
ncbi:MAG: hypothetical protein HRT88_22885 [Lentisphaeraceae bacterium]|nr:hypothetical protein [Lentisphaeraceae bacterium]